MDSTLWATCICCLILIFHFVHEINFMSMIKIWPLVLFSIVFTTENQTISYGQWLMTPCCWNIHKYVVFKKIIINQYHKEYAAVNSHLNPFKYKFNNHLNVWYWKTDTWTFVTVAWLSSKLLGTVCVSKPMTPRCTKFWFIKKRMEIPMVSSRYTVTWFRHILYWSWRSVEKWKEGCTFSLLPEIYSEQISVRMIILVEYPINDSIPGPQTFSLQSTTFCFR